MTWILEISFSFTDIKRHERPAKINPRGDKALCVWRREEYVSRVHSPPHNDGIRIPNEYHEFGLNSHFS